MASSGSGFLVLSVVIEFGAICCSVQLGDSVYTERLAEDIPTFLGYSRERKEFHGWVWSFHEYTQLPNASIAWQ